MGGKGGREDMRVDVGVGCFVRAWSNFRLDKRPERALPAKLAGQSDAGTQGRQIIFSTKEVLINERMRARVARTQFDFAPALRPQQNCTASEAIRESRLERRQVRTGAKRYGAKDKLNIWELDIRSGL